MATLPVTVDVVPSSSELIDYIKALSPIVSIVLGGFIFKWISDSKERTHEKKKKALDFVEGTVHDVNMAIAYLFGRVKFRDINQENMKELIKRKSILYEKRFLINVYSKAYVNHPNFHIEYDEICRRVGNLVHLLYSHKINRPVNLPHPEIASNVIIQFQGRPFREEDYHVALEELEDLNNYAINSIQNFVEHSVA